MSATNDIDLSYGQHDHYYGVYNFIKILPDSSASTVVITAGGGSDLIFQIPSRTACSLAKTILYFTSTPVAAGSGVFNWQWLHTVPFFQRVSVYTTNGKFLMDVDNMANRVMVESKINTPVPKLMNNDIPQGGAGVWEGINVTNGLVTSTTAGSFGKHADGVGTTKSYTETRELIPGGDNTATPVINWQIPLATFQDILADPRLLAFNEQLFLKFQMSPVAKAYFAAASATDPTSTPVAGTSITLSGIQLQLAVCQDIAICKGLLDRISSTQGIEMLFDYTNALKLSTSGTQQAMTNNITRAFGSRLKSVLLTVLNQPETANTAYKRSNVAQAIWTQLQTFINSVPQQIIPLISANYDDYQHLKKLLKGSAYQSYPEYAHDWFFMDYYYDHLAVKEDPTIICGIELLSQIVYQAQFTTVSASNIIYCWQKFQRRLNININGTFVDGA